MLALIFATDAGLGDRKAPPIETLTVQRVGLPEPGMIELDVVNDGPDPITIAQVLVDDAYWQFAIEPGRRAGPARIGDDLDPLPVGPGRSARDRARQLDRRALRRRDRRSRSRARAPTARASLRFGLVGLYVGVVPVALGLLWYPFLRRLGRRGMNFVLALTVGLLLFLVVDMFGEAQEVAARPRRRSLDATVLVPVLAMLTAAFLATVGHAAAPARRRRDGESQSGLSLAYQIAIGIGLHNLGEGLAIGAAFALGEAALGVFLIVGFTLHNVTEGVGIAAPIVRKRPPLWHFVALAAVAGGPAILGTWIGAFTYSPFWTTVFLAIGIGAILQVIVEVGRLIVQSQARHDEPALTWTTFGGVTAGIAVMYVTALLVAA